MIKKFQIFESKLSVSDFNIEIVEPRLFPLKLYHLRDFMLNEKEDAINYTYDLNIKYDEKLYTTQSVVFSEPKSMNEYAWLIKHGRKYWIVDGHHRLIIDRMEKKNTNCKIIDSKNKREIEYDFYGVD